MLLLRINDVLGKKKLCREKQDIYDNKLISIRLMQLIKCYLDNLYQYRMDKYLLHMDELKETAKEFDISVKISFLRNDVLLR